MTYRHFRWFVLKWLKYFIVQVLWAPSCCCQLLYVFFPLLIPQFFCEVFAEMRILFTRIWIGKILGQQQWMFRPPSLLTLVVARSALFWLASCSLVVRLVSLTSLSSTWLLSSLTWACSPCTWDLNKTQDVRSCQLASVIRGSSGSGFWIRFQIQGLLNPHKIILF